MQQSSECGTHGGEDCGRSSRNLHRKNGSTEILEPPDKSRGPGDLPLFHPASPGDKYEDAGATKELEDGNGDRTEMHSERNHEPEDGKHDLAQSTMTMPKNGDQSDDDDGIDVGDGVASPKKGFLVADDLFSFCHSGVHPPVLSTAWRRLCGTARVCAFSEMNSGNAHGGNDDVGFSLYSFSD